MKKDQHPRNQNSTAHGYPYKGIATDYEMHVNPSGPGTKITPLTFRNDRLRSIFLNHQHSTSISSNNHNNNNNSGSVGAVGNHHNNSGTQTSLKNQQVNQQNQTSGQLFTGQDSKVIKIPILHSSKNFRQLYNLSFKSQTSKTDDFPTQQAQSSIHRQSIQSSQEKIRNTSISPKGKLLHQNHSPVHQPPRTAQRHTRRRTEQFIPNTTQIQLFQEISQDHNVIMHNNNGSTRQATLKQVFIGGNVAFNSKNSGGKVSLSNAASNYISQQHNSSINGNLNVPAIGIPSESRTSHQLIQSTFTHSKLDDKALNIQSRITKKEAKGTLPDAIAMNKIMDFVNNQSNGSNTTIVNTVNTNISLPVGATHANPSLSDNRSQKRATTAATQQSSRPNEPEQWSNHKRLSTQEIELIKKRNKSFLEGLNFDYQTGSNSIMIGSTNQTNLKRPSIDNVRYDFTRASLKPQLIDDRALESKLIRLQQQSSLYGVNNNEWKSMSGIQNQQNLLLIKNTQVENKMMRKKRDFQISKKVNTGRQSSERLHSPSTGQQHLRSSSINSQYGSNSNQQSINKKQRVKLVFLDEEQANTLNANYNNQLDTDEGLRSSSILKNRKEVNDYLEYESRLGRSNQKQLKLTLNYKKFQDKEYPQILKLLKDDTSLVLQDSQQDERKVIQFDLNIQGNDYNTQEGTNQMIPHLQNQQSYYTNSYQEISLLGVESHNHISSKHMHDSSEVVLENPEIIRGSFQFENHQIRAIKNGSTLTNQSYFPNFIEENAIHIYRNSKEIQTSQPKQ
ncbi:UNKNOWN [Stylonychia lemnae]|uniref:Uncharacterized protein n=1 Tax=Stylonychia lemnae TaxID=5949 RepID=A0A078AJH6_STYLE|nr:UNKNOWN [Stylonychia lemnae]|eukprot:CDW81642.1 UNKNOWN [Stylonychia lemnae]